MGLPILLPIGWRTASLSETYQLPPYLDRAGLGSWLLGNANEEARHEVYTILKAFGTKASVPALQRMAKEDAVLCPEAEDTLQAIAGDKPDS